MSGNATACRKCRRYRSPGLYSYLDQRLHRLPLAIINNAVAAPDIARAWREIFVTFVIIVAAPGRAVPVDHRHNPELLSSHRCAIRGANLLTSDGFDAARRRRLFEVALFGSLLAEGENL